MRDTFIKTLCELAEKDNRVTLVTGDLGFGVLDDYRSRFPRQFINAGIAEQSMAGLATGLAMEGHIVFLYSIANFTFMRCLEQLRNGAAYHNANVNVVSVGGGFSYGQLGMSHHATEDLAIMRSMPTNMVACPAEDWEVSATTRAMAATAGLKYLRLDKSASRSTHPSAPTSINPGIPRLIRAGSDVTIVACGGIVDEVLSAATHLSRQGVSAEVLTTAFLKPFEPTYICRSVEKTNALITVEEHSISGGLGGLLAEELGEKSRMPRLFRRIGLREPFASVVGDQTYLRQVYGMSAEGIVNCIKALLGSSSHPLAA